MEGQLSNWTPIIGSLAPSSPSYIIKFNWLIQLLFLWGHLPAFWTPLWLWIQANQLLVIFLSNGNALDWLYLQNGPVLNFSLSKSWQSWFFPSDCKQQRSSLMWKYNVMNLDRAWLSESAGSLKWHLTSFNLQMNLIHLKNSRMDKYFLLTFFYFRLLEITLLIILKFRLLNSIEQDSFMFHEIYTVL